MFRFFHNRGAQLGHLETKVMEILWQQGEGTVNDVSSKLSRPLAYTTVMTTLDRLFKKGLLNRQKTHRAFLYSPRLSRPQWEQQQAGHLVSSFLAGGSPSGRLLISTLVDAATEHDATLLDELEKTIRKKRRELRRRET